MRFILRGGLELKISSIPAGALADLPFHTVIKTPLPIHHPTLLPERRANCFPRKTLLKEHAVELLCTLNESRVYSHPESISRCLTSFFIVGSPEPVG